MKGHGRCQENISLQRTPCDRTHVLKISSYWSKLELDFFFFSGDEVGYHHLYSMAFNIHNATVVLTTSKLQKCQSLDRSALHHNSASSLFEANCSGPRSILATQSVGLNGNDIYAGGRTIVVSFLRRMKEVC